MQKATQWPKGLELTDAMVDWANNRGLLNAAEEWEAFEDYHKSKGTKFVDWERAWHTWIRNSIKWGKNGNGKRAESFGERNIRETAEGCRAVRGRAGEVLREVAASLPKPAHETSAPSLFRGIIGPES